MAFKKGDILEGEKREFYEAYHPIVYIDGPDDAPLAVILTHSNPDKYPCNIKLSKVYDLKDTREQYFVSHYIQKLPDWGEYKKVDELTEIDLNLIEVSIQNQYPITWDDYMRYTKNGCPDHKN